MLVAVSRQLIAPEREDVYLASVDDQERVIAESPDFGGRTVLRVQGEPGRYWLLDRWTDEGAMGMALAMARTIASVAALVEAPDELLAGADEVARGLGEGGPGEFWLVGRGWVKEPCLPEYEETVRLQADRLRERPGFLRRLLLVDRADARHRFVVDEWANERAAYESFQSNPVGDGEALRFLALFAEREAPVFGTAVHALKEMSR